MQDTQGKKWAGNLGAVAVALVVALVLGEIALRVMGFSYHLYPEKIEFGWPDPQTLEDQFVPDKDLFWVPKGYSDVLAAARRDAPRLIFMGDSCTQYGRYDRHLAALFERETGEPLAFTNVGAGGWTTHQGLRQLERDIVPLSPTLVTIYYGWNDHWIGFGIEDKDIARVTSSPVAFLEKLRLGQLISKTLVVVLHRQRDKGVLRRVSLEDYRSNLEAMVDLARQHDIVPVLVTAPSAHVQGDEPKHLQGRFVADIDELVPLHRAYNDIVRTVAGEKDVALADLAAEFDRLSSDLVRYSYFQSDGIHLRDSGNRKLAEMLYARLEREGLLDQLR